MNKPVISFNGYRISKIDYKVVDKEEKFDEYTEKNGQIKLIVERNSNDDKIAKLTIGTIVIDKQNMRVVEVDISGIFDIDSDIDEESIRIYLTQNGTAMLFPYLRSIISMITSLDNENSIILPTINTTGFVEDEIEDQN